MLDGPAYFSDWHKVVRTCACGWSGAWHAMKHDLFKQVEGSCPTCGASLVIVQYPDDLEVRRAAARGGEDAIRMLVEDVEAARHPPGALS